MRLTITLIVLSSSDVSVFNRLTHCHILSPSVISLVSERREEFHMGIIIMITDVLIFNCEKGDKQSPIGFEIYYGNKIRFVEGRYEMHWHLASLVDVWSERSTCMMSSYPRWRLFRFPIKRHEQDDISSLSNSASKCAARGEHQENYLKF